MQFRFKSINYFLIFSFAFLSLFSVLKHQVAWEWPLIELYPGVERLIDSSFNSGDFYTDQFDSFTAKSVPVFLIAKVSSFLNVDYTYMMAWANVFRIFFTPTILFIFFYSFSRNIKISFFGSIFGLVNYYQIPHVIGWWFIQKNAGMHNWITVLGLLFIAGIYHKKFLLVYIASGLAFFIHPLITLHSLILGTCLLVFKDGVKDYIEQIKNKNYIIGAFFFLICFCSYYVPFVLSNINSGITPGEFIDIYAYTRVPGHFIMSSMPMQRWILFILFGGLFILKYFEIRNDFPYLKKVGFGVIVFYSFMLILGFVFVEIFPSKAFVTFAPLRSLIFFIPFYLLISATFFRFLIQRQHYFLALFYCSSFLSIFYWSKIFELVNLNIFVGKSHTLLVFYWHFFISFVYFIFKVIHLPKLKWPKFEKWAVSLIVLTCLVEILSFPNIPRFNIPDVYAKENKLFQWIKENTSESALLIGDLSIDKELNQKIRLLSKRRVIVSKDFPFMDKYLVEWNNRFQDIFNGTIHAKGYIDSLSEEKLEGIFLKYEADFLLRSKPVEANKKFHLEEVIIYKGKDTYIYSFKD